jgi:hypothetical protein
MPVGRPGWFALCRPIGIGVAPPFSDRSFLSGDLLLQVVLHQYSL